MKATRLSKIEDSEGAGFGPLHPLGGHWARPWPPMSKGWAHLLPITLEAVQKERGRAGETASSFRSLEGESWAQTRGSGLVQG